MRGRSSSRECELRDWPRGPNRGVSVKYGARASEQRAARFALSRCSYVVFAAITRAIRAPAARTLRKRHMCACEKSIGNIYSCDLESFINCSYCMRCVCMRMHAPAIIAASLIIRRVNHASLVNHVESSEN